jgi:hypothetical protein
MHRSSILLESHRLGVMNAAESIDYRMPDASDSFPPKHIIENSFPP